MLIHTFSSLPRTNGVPSLGWDDTIAFLILPVFLVISQFASMQLMQPKTDDPAQQQSNAILKVLPIMIGWFSLNVPAALCLYWITNNIITTATSVIIRNSLKVETVTPGSSSPRAAVEPPAIFSPPREKPTGFGAPTYSPDDVKPITAMDAEVIEDDEAEEDETEASSGEGGSKKRGGKKKRKKKN